MSRPVVLLVLLLIAQAAKPLCAQEEASSGAPSGGEPAGSPSASAAARDDTQPRGLVDAGDLWRYLRHRPAPAISAAAQSPKRPFFFVSPSVSSKPSTGLSVGVASSVVFVHGDPSTTQISSADASVSDSVNGQAGTSLRFRIFMPDDRWFIQGDNRLAWSSLETYPLGIVSDVTGERLKYDRLRFYDSVFLQVKPRLFVGAGLNVNTHTDVRPDAEGSASFPQSAYAAYTAQHGYPTAGQVSSGMNVSIFADTRNNSINAARGWFASATYRTFFDGFLGGDASWQLLEIDARTYKSLTRDGRQKLAFWMLGEFVTGGTAPFLDLPAIAEDTYGRSARGYTSGRYRGPRLLYGEVEYRTTLSANGLLGAVAFANTTAIDGGVPGQELFSTLAPAAGGGLRVLLSKRSHANFCLDYGWGIHGSHGLYIAVRETF